MQIVAEKKILKPDHFVVHAYIHSHETAEILIGQPITRLIIKYNISFNYINIHTYLTLTYPYVYNTITRAPVYNNDVI